MLAGFFSVRQMRRFQRHVRIGLPFKYRKLMIARRSKVV
jgi:hypothetical protein